MMKDAAQKIRQQQEQVRRACAAVWNRIQHETDESKRERLYRQYFSGLAARAHLCMELERLT